MYFIISAVLRLVATIGTSKPAYTLFMTSRLLASSAPMTMRSGSMKSATAFPSRRNSGFIAKPNSPDCFPENCSNMPLTTVSVVVGTTVLLTQTTWYSSFPFKAAPISWAACFTCPRSIPPSPRGVPTAIIVTAASSTAAFVSPVAFKLPEETTCCRIPSKPGS